MAGAAIEMTIKDEQVLENFARLERAMGNTTPVMNAIGTGLVSSTTKRFVSQTDPDGVTWAAVNDEYAEGKKNSRILTESGRLRDSITHKASRDAVLVGSNVIYAAIHQFGGVINAKSGGRLSFFIGGKLARPTSVTMPARPYLGISKDDENMIGDVIKGFVTRHLP